MRRLLILLCLGVLLAAACGDLDGTDEEAEGPQAVEELEDELDSDEEPSFRKPERHRGRGQDVIDTEWPAEIGIVTFTCRNCSGNTAVQTDGAESLLVNTIGPYKGTRWINIGEGDVTTTFTITADGAWTLRIADLDSVERVQGKASGTGDDVIFIDQDSSRATITNRGEGNFAIEVLSGSGRDLAVNEIGSFQGTVPLEGPALVQVTSEGNWTIDPS